MPSPKLKEQNRTITENIPLLFILLFFHTDANVKRTFDMTAPYRGVFTFPSRPERGRRVGAHDLMRSTRTVPGPRCSGYARSTYLQMFNRKHSKYLTFMKCTLLNDKGTVIRRGNHRACSLSRDHSLAAHVCVLSLLQLAGVLTCFQANQK